MSQHCYINLFYRIKTVLISQSSDLDIMKENSSFYITQEEKDEINKFLEMNYYQIVDKNENIETRIMNIVKLFTVCTDSMSIKLIVR